MALPRYFPRAVTAIGQHFSIPRDRLESFLDGTCIDVYLGEDCEKEGNAQWTSTLLLNILARLYPWISIRGSAKASKAAILLVKKINPKVKIKKDGTGSPVMVAVGVNEELTPGVLCPSSSGWVARLTQNGEQSLRGANNIYAASFAAGLAAAEIFRSIFESHLDDHSPIEQAQVSLLDYSKENGIDLPLPKVDLGDVAFVGLGAVGNSALWSISRHEGIGGKLWLVDHESVDVTNLQRYVLALNSDENKVKSDLAARELEKSGLSYVKCEKRLEDFAEEFSPSFKIPTICISVDNFDDRRVAQALLPRLVVNGYTGTKDLGASWHQFDDREKPCLACLYFGSPAKSELKLMEESLGLESTAIVNLLLPGILLNQNHIKAIEKFRNLPDNSLFFWEGKHIKDIYTNIVCGSLGVALGDGGQSETVPLAHQSVLAGILMAVELVKRTTPELSKMSQDEELVTWSNILRPPPNKWGYSQPPTRGCICSDVDYREVFKAKWGA